MRSARRGHDLGNPRQADPPEDVSVVVPVYNDRERLQDCLHALVGQDYPEDHLEVVVVDNGSRDGVEELVDRFGGSVLFKRESRRGSYAARNTGVRHASGDIVAFTDADCVPDPLWIKNGVERLTRGEADLLGGRVEVFPDDPGRPTGFEVVDLLTAFPQQVYVEERDFAVTANMMTKAEVLEKVGLFDDTLMSGGDMEFGQRAVAAGFNLEYAPDAVIRHPARATFSEHRKKLARVTRGKVALGTVNAERPLFSSAAQWVPPLRHSIKSVRRLPWLPMWSRMAGVCSLVVSHYLKEYEERKARRSLRRSQAPDAVVSSA